MNVRRLFVTGTDTEVGKTVASAALTLGLDAVYWKPVQAGRDPATDTERVRTWTHLPESRFVPEAYVLREPASPHYAAELEGVEVEVDRVLRTSLPTDRPVVIEGVGGLLVPLNETTLVADLIGLLDVPTVLVARTSLGTLNHTLLSISEMRRRQLPLLGVVLNGEPHASNERTVERYGRVPILGRIPPLSSLDPPSLLEAFRGLDLDADVLAGGSS